jgi:hypothetical protein
MNPQKRRPASVATDPAQTTALRTPNDTPRPKKWKRILATLLSRSLNRFEAERQGDHCMNSTVSKIEHKGVRILREPERVPGFAGTVAHVVRYRLAPTSRERALELLGRRAAAST